MKRANCTPGTRQLLNLRPAISDRLRPPHPNGHAVQSLVIQADGAASVPPPLTDREMFELTECEGILDRALATFFDAGMALLRIRDSRLYRATHENFRDYCQERWNIGPSYAWRLIGAAERISLLPADPALPKPSSESQIRPFLKLPAQEFPGAWKRVVTIAEGRVTRSVLETVIHDLLPDNRPARASGKRRQRKPTPSKLPLGQILMILQDARRRILHHETDEALAALDKLEALLCGLE
jgi:hypothetical protein